ncbi:hypothetical protein K458DRAFT_363820 [Lentithecium fluviatile CBS 122367]|uniref:Zn(2)-C6 fungal-type domain-containing protein n=1 Tax=Lentithecium fluviatile CBS 122367 TaxID=1168545 RepID=A0A6G1J7U1_9PLEO|nr:hypothetical protein K458DRAFT_363820 [Lentithecium fluviatile CBS 122367]
MKRAHSSIDSPQSQSQPPSQIPSRRQEPVSCQFCRQKKLRCSRESPCSNCVARNIKCVHVTSRGATVTTPGPSVSGANPGGLTLQSLHARLQRIENALNINSDGATTSPAATTSAETDNPRAPLSSHTTPQAHEPPVQHDQDRAEFSTVEITNRIARSGSLLAPEVDTSQLLQLLPSDPSTHLTCSQWREQLPSYERAVQLLDFYAHNVCWTYHFVHVPTLRRHLQQTYQYLEQDGSPEPSVLALLCSVFALAKYFTHQQGTGNEVPGEQGYGTLVALTSRALSQARHLDHPTLESIQAVLLLASSLLLNTGATTAFRILLTAMYMSAQALLIHQIDSPKNQQQRRNTAYDHVELEMKRRIWWHIASSDWIFAFISGTQTETYIVPSSRTHVSLPSNADDAAITTSHSPSEPDNVPTEMTYFLFRCRLSIIFREFMDTAAEKGLGIDEVPYDDVLVFDAKINTFIDSVPYFLKTTPESRQRCVQLDQQRPYLIWQRLMAQFGASTRMSGLHRPYIALGARDPKFAYSRMVCLRSARTVLEFEKILRAEMAASPTLMMPDPSKIWAMMYQVFFATMVLVMDYHFNRDEPRAREREDEILECCRRLERASGVSSVARRGLEELKGVMRQWGLLADGASNSRGAGAERQHTGGGDGGGGIDGGATWAATDSGQITGREPVQDQDVTPITVDEFATSSWMDSWDFNVDLDIPQWNALFQDLESRSGMF